ncbi:hypothetical protein BASA60_011032 [Batrachochytrium salamandrivorans]|nr:hypothetical protein BASA60_011032 [Batrachochytrium salamandrivorans]
MPGQISKNEPIVNYMLISDSSTFFLESVSTGEQSHDAKWIAQDMGRVIDSLVGKFVEHLDKAIMILNPVDTTIVVFQSDSVPVSQIYQSFANTMKQQYEMMSCLSDAERFLFAAITTIEIGFLISRCNWDRIFARSSANHNKDRKDFRFLMLEKGTKTILQFWLVDGLEFPQLRDLALQVFGYGCAQVPRQRGVFPPWGFVHSKLRSSLGSEKVKKLVYIKTNASQFGNQNMKDLGRYGNRV